MRASTLRSRGEHPLGLGWAPLILVSTLGFSGTPSLPIWLAAAIERFHLSPQHAGLMASLELGCIAIGSIASAILFRSDRHATRLVAAIALSMIGNLGSMLADDAATLVGCRLLVGLSYGAALAEITRRTARTPEPHRVFAMQQLGLVAFATLFFSTAPQTVAAFGGPTLFAYNLALGALALASLAWLPNSHDTGSDVKPNERRGGRPSPEAAITFAAIALTFAAQNSIWTYIARAANAAGVASDSLGRTLAVGAVLNLLAPLASAGMGFRFGRLLPLLLAYTLLAASILLISMGWTPLAFSIGAVGINWCMMFLIPFLLGSLARQDSSGRSASAGPAFFTIGAAIGPALGGFVLGKAGFSTLAPVSLSIAAVALMLMWAAQARRGPAPPALATPAVGPD